MAGREAPRFDGDDHGRGAFPKVDRENSGPVDNPPDVARANVDDFPEIGVIVVGQQVRSPEGWEARRVRLDSGNEETMLVPLVKRPALPVTRIAVGGGRVHGGGGSKKSENNARRKEKKMIGLRKKKDRGAGRG